MGLLRIDVPWRSGAWVLCSALGLCACGGGSDAQVGTPGGGGSTGGNTGGAATGGAATGGGSAVPDGSAAGTGGNGGTAGMGGAAGGGATGGGAGSGGGATADASGRGGSSPGTEGGASCPSLTSLTLAVHQVLQVTWPNTLGTNGGTGVAHIWNRTKLAVNGTSVSGDETTGCGTALPALTLGGVGAIFTGQGMVQVDVPDAVWDQPTMPKFHTQGTLAGFNIGSVVHIDPTVALVGLTMPDPMAAWPASYTGITAKVDADGDGKDGFTAVPRMGTGFVNPPIGIGQQDTADKLYLVSRNVIGLDGTVTACETISGTAHVTFFDNHVVGCHTTGGTDCTTTANGQTSFVDSNRTIYTVTSATFTAKRVPDTATCADVRAALPL